jgi:hypothetical protein
MVYNTNYPKIIKGINDYWLQLQIEPELNLNIQY